MDTKAQRFSLSLNTLKFIAIIAMTVSHCGYIFVPLESPLGAVMNSIGRITAPIMFFAAVEGYHHTRNIRKYILRLAIFALISQIPFAFFISGGKLPSTILDYFSYINVIYTILLGVLAIHVHRNSKNLIASVLIILGIFFFSGPGDWSHMGIFIVLIFDGAYGSYKKQALYYGIFSTFFSLLDTGIFWNGFTNLSLADFSQFTTLIPAVLILFYNGKRGGGGVISKWFFYIYYPLHLVVLGLLAF